MKVANSVGKILVAEDEDDIRRILRYNFEREGYRVVEASDGEAALAKFRKDGPDLVILDIMLPKVDGLEVLRQIRSLSQVPAMFLTAKGKELDRILGIRLGADDYVVKPFSIGELMARVQAILRRAAPRHGAGASPVLIGAMKVDFGRCEVSVGGQSVSLTSKEFSLLQVLIEAKGNVLSRKQILKSVWGYSENAALDTRTVDQHVARLRRKLRAESGRLATVVNKGYKFRVEPSAAGRHTDATSAPAARRRGPAGGDPPAARA